MLGGILEATVGGVLVAIPDPATTGAGIGMITDGTRRVTEELDEM
ncbi:MAG: hypothetical protein ACQEP9_04390 [Bacillota bacterium]